MGLSSIASSLRKYRVAERILDSIALHKWGRVYYKLAQKKQGERIPVSPFWENASEYFERDNIKEKVKSNLSIFADEESCRQYQGVIAARKSLCYADVPTINIKKLPHQYFDEAIIPKSEHHVFVDGGAWIGDTIYWIEKKWGGYDRIIAFEPGDRQYKRLWERYGSKENVCLVHSGLWNCDGELPYKNTNAGGDGKIVSIEESTDMIKVTAIDHMKECADATFIKMDVEGSEMMALKGAEKTIRKNHPILAICLYHSNEDMVEIPNWLYEKFPEYKYYFRHYTYGLTESVLYAIM